MKGRGGILGQLGAFYFDPQMGSRGFLFPLGLLKEKNACWYRPQCVMWDWSLDWASAPCWEPSTDLGALHINRYCYLTNRDQKWDSEWLNDDMPKVVELASLMRSWELKRALHSRSLSETGCSQWWGCHWVFHSTLSWSFIIGCNHQLVYFS